MNNIKIKVIDLLNKIANGEKVPKKIKILGNVFEWFGDSYRKENANLEYISDYCRLDCMLNDEIEILEDNTEEIEELTAGDLANIDGMANSRIMNKFNKLVKVVNQIRKDLNK